MAGTGDIGAPARIRGRYRLYLALKGALLLLLFGVFAALTAEAALGGERHWAVRAVLGAFFLVPAVFLGWTALLACTDALLGAARRIPGAVPLASRRSGVSLRLPNGHFAEYVLHNPWAPLQAGRTYTVTCGRWSGVLVAPPEEEPAP